jgi:ABC-type transport system involved in multi-copper enzyme maturation permease subunit
MMDPFMFLVWIYIWSTIFTCVAGGDILASDRKFNTVTLYFSRPIQKDDYFVGKFLTMFAMVSLVCLLPSIIQIAMVYGVYTGMEGADIDVNEMARGFLVLGILMTFVFACIAMAFSSITKSRGFASLGIFVFIFMSEIISNVFAYIVDRNFGYMSIMSDLGMVLAHAADFDTSASFYQWHLALAALIIMSGFFLGLSYMQIKRMDLSE